MGKAENESAEDILSRAKTADQIFDTIEFAPSNGPDWRIIPNDFHIKEANQYAQKDGEIDPVIALKLWNMEHFKGEAQKYKRWYNGARSLIVSPEETAPGMEGAAELISETIDNGDKIAVFCDYDVDGITSGEVFRRGLEPYSDNLHYGYASGKFGLTNEFVEEAAANGCKLLVTLDCGSEQVDQVALAQSLGMKVIVVDHHNISGESTADFHLNPHLQEPASSYNTGAQLSWKLAAALQECREGEIPEDHYHESLNLAGLGALADMGSVMLPENRAFFWGANEDVPLGVRVLAEKLEEDSTKPGACVTTIAALNLPKRTPRVSAETTSKLLAAKDEAEAEKIATEIYDEYQQAKVVRKAMQEKAFEQIGMEEWKDGAVQRSNPEKRVAVAVLKDNPEYAGYSGVIANNVARKNSTPALIFTHRGVDEHGQDLYKFSMRSSGTSSSVHLGEIIEHQEMRDACKIQQENDSGEIVENASIGGHKDSNVVSGTCTVENIDNVTKIVEDYLTKSAPDIKRYWRSKYKGPEAWILERRVSPDRLAKIEAQAGKLGPFSFQRQMVLEPKPGKEEPKRIINAPPEISVIGVLGKLEEDPEEEFFLRSKLTLSNGETRDVLFSKQEAESAPVGTMCEWVIGVSGDKNPYRLKKFHQIA